MSILVLRSINIIIALSVCTLHIIFIPCSIKEAYDYIWYEIGKNYTLDPCFFSLCTESFLYIYIITRFQPHPLLLGLRTKSCFVFFNMQHSQALLTSRFQLPLKNAKNVS